MEETLAYCRSTVYREDPSQLHEDITKGVWEWVKQRVSIPPNARILDVGAGFGSAMRLMKSDGFDPCAITLNEEERAALAAEFGQGNVGLADMHEIGSLLGLQGIWMRHSLEHSPMPFVVLRAAKKALMSKGFLYVECPSPISACKHYSNVNHFSCHTKEMWRELILRAGFTIVDEAEIQFEVLAGPDTYYSFLGIA